MAVCGKRSRSASSIVGKKSSGYHILTIDGYSGTLTKTTGEYLQSVPFTVGGHRWHLRYYPNGYNAEVKDYISIFLYLHDSEPKSVNVQFRIRFVGNVAKQPLTLKPVSRISSAGRGHFAFIKREAFEASEHLRDDSFTIRCDVVVINEFCAEEAAMISVPPSDLQQHLGSLLRTEKGADVVFDVVGEKFAAHRCVLAARSPVFSAELFGAMRESDIRGVVHIEDMEPRVFKSLLYFIYTDLFPKTETENEGEEGDDDNGDEGVFPHNILTKKTEDEDIDILSQHLFVAANKYNLERLKLLCESKLSEYINVDTIATILALADQHHCRELKGACFRFLSSPANLREAMANDDFKHLIRSCSSIMEELVTMLGT